MELDNAYSANLLFFIYINVMRPILVVPLVVCLFEISFFLGFTITSQAKQKTCATTKNILIWITKITAVQIL